MIRVAIFHEKVTGETDAAKRQSDALRHFDVKHRERDRNTGLASNTSFKKLFFGSKYSHGCGQSPAL